MKKIFFTPGPSQLYPTVKKHIKNALSADIPSISHRGESFQKIYQNTQNNLRKLLKIPQTHKIFFLSSALEGMERIIENCVEKSSFHLINGAFSKKFFDIARLLGKKPVKVEVEQGEGFEFEKITIPKNTELICLTQNETSTGVWLPLPQVYKIKKKYPKTSIALDIVSSVPYTKVDFNFIDCAFFSVQKGFGLPAGLGVLIVSQALIEKSKKLVKKGISIGSYHSFLELSKKDEKFQTPETPNVLNIYLLGKVTQDLLRIGINKIRQETRQKAQFLYAFFDKHPLYKPFVKNPLFRSETVIVVKTGKETKKVIARLKDKGLIVGKGYGQFKEKHIRIANFPAHNLRDMKKIVKTLQQM